MEGGATSYHILMFYQRILKLLRASSVQLCRTVGPGVGLLSLFSRRQSKDDDDESGTCIEQ